MVKKLEYIISDEYPGPAYRIPGRMHIGQGHGALIRPDGSGTVWKNEDLHGGLVVTRRFDVTQAEIETGGITTCCIAAVTSENATKIVIHARFQEDMAALLGFGLDQIPDESIKHIELDNRAPEKTQTSYSQVVESVLLKRDRRAVIVHRRSPQPLDIAHPYSIRH